MMFVTHILSITVVIALITPIRVFAERYALNLPARGTIGQCSPSNVTGLEFNSTISAPGAIGVFTTSPSGRDYLNTLTDLSPLTDPNNSNAVPFPPMSCWNPNNTATNTTLFQACNAKMPPDFKFQSQPLCVVFKSDRDPAMTVTLDVTWMTGDGVALRGNDGMGVVGGSGATNDAMIGHREVSGMVFSVMMTSFVGWMLS